MYERKANKVKKSGIRPPNPLKKNRGSTLNSSTCIACQWKRKPPINFAELGRNGNMFPQENGTF
jgi:hypothetical protein